MRPRLLSLSVSVFAAGLVLGGTATSGASAPAAPEPTRAPQSWTPYVGPTSTGLALAEHPAAQGWQHPRQEAGSHPRRADAGSRG